MEKNDSSFLFIAIFKIGNFSINLKKNYFVDFHFVFSSEKVNLR
jgi:hypothetical protein